MNNIVHFGPSGNDPLTMSSREIADVCSKQHKHVKRDIEKMFADLKLDGSKFGRIYLDGKNREQIEYVLDKTHTRALVMGYSIQLRVKVLNYIDELEYKLLNSQHSTASKEQVSLLREARISFNQNLRIAKMGGLNQPQEMLAANKWCVFATGIDYLNVMGLGQVKSIEQYHDLTPTLIGEKLGISSREVNKLLCVEGYQIQFRDHKNRPYYEMTELGRKSGGVMKDTGKKHSNGTPVKQLMWSSRIIPELQDLLEGV